MSLFTIEQIQAAHQKVRSGADFPAYIRALKQLGVRFYKTYVSDGHTEYYGDEAYKIVSPAKYDLLPVADSSNGEQFAIDLKEHQQGKTGYAVFCQCSAEAGVEAWTVCMDEMKCTYYDRQGNKLLAEDIPL